MLSERDRLAYEDVPEPILAHFKFEFLGPWGTYGIACRRWDGRRWRLIASLVTLGM